MSILKFTTGTMSTGKTLILISEAIQIQRIHGNDALKILKPSIDNRDSIREVTSALNKVSLPVNHLIRPGESLLNLNFERTSHIFVDEVQFFEEKQILELRKLAEKGISVNCFGISKTFQNEQFPSIAVLMTVADKVKTLSCPCALCSKRKGRKFRELDKEATCNMRIRMEGKKIRKVTEGATIEIGGSEMYLPVCYSCYENCGDDEYFGEEGSVRESVEMESVREREERYKGMEEKDKRMESAQEREERYKRMEEEYNRMKEKYKGIEEGYKRMYEERMNKGMNREYKETTRRVNDKCEKMEESKMNVSDDKENRRMTEVPPLPPRQMKD